MNNNTLILDLILGNIDLFTDEQQNDLFQDGLDNLDSVKKELSSEVWEKVRMLLDAQSNKIYNDVLLSYAKFFKIGALLMLEILK